MNDFRKLLWSCILLAFQNLTQKIRMIFFWLKNFCEFFYYLSVSSGPDSHDINSSSGERYGESFDIFLFLYFCSIFSIFFLKKGIKKKTCILLMLSVWLLDGSQYLMIHDLCGQI